MDIPKYYASKFFDDSTLGDEICEIIERRRFEI